MKRLLFLTILILFLTHGKAQFIEKLYLKDSTTIYTGWIVEQVPQDYIKLLRLKERDTVEVKTEEIWKIVRVIDPKNHLIPFGQKSKRDQTIYAEVLGNGLFYSLNYDTRLQKNKREGWGLRAGIGIISISAKDTVNNLKGRVAITSIPLMANYIIGKNRSGLEVGIGPTILLAKLKDLRNSAPDNVSTSNLLDEPLTANNIYLTGVIGYRYRALNNGFLFRIGLTPYVSDGAINMSGGLSLGFVF